MIDGRSGKLERMGELLEELLAAGDRALIFTQIAEMGQMLASYLPAAFGAGTQFLHGGTSAKARDQMVKRFQDEEHAPPVFILSLKAGGTGLNLTRANHVFHFDRWWNPAVEDQATDRAFRIGQKRNVQVHKFVTTGTLEEMIDDMIESKKGLAQAVVGSGEGWLTEMSTDELRKVISLRRQ
jgi:SNF2 family DNA or RNA helicase